MDRIEKFSENEFKIIQDLYRKNINKFFFGIIMVLVGQFILFKAFEKIPARFFGKRGRGINGTFIENIGYTIPIIILVIISIFIIIVIHNELKVSKYKKDLKYKNKIIASLKVKEVKNFSDDVIKDFREIGKMETSSLIFEKNKFQINYYSFDKFANPEMLNAELLNLEIAQHSKYEFKKEITFANSGSYVKQHKVINNFE